MAKLTIDDLELGDKRVLVRVDFNVPLDEHGRITDDTRIVESLPTIRKILTEGGKAILMSHLGRPKGRVVESLRLRPVAERLSQLLGQEVGMAPDCIGQGVRTMVDALKEGGCLLLENLRFHPGEEANDPDFSRELAHLGELYVNDAFGTAHRAHASTVGVTRFFAQRAAGYLMARELEYLSRALENPQRPFVALLGGAKISGKIELIHNLLGRVDAILIGGGMAFTFFRAQGLEVGDSLLEEDLVGLAGQTLEEARRRGVELLLPVDCVVADRFAPDADTQVVKRTEIPPGWQALDIGPQTVELFSSRLREAKTVLWNGPMGVFELEPFARGTEAMARTLAQATEAGAITIIGGGDSAAAVAKLGLKDRMSHVSTGGGASLEFLSGKELPGVSALSDK